MSGQIVGYIGATLTLQFDGDVPPFDLGRVTIPLRVARTPEHTTGTTNTATFEVGLDLQELRTDISRTINESTGK